MKSGRTFPGPSAPAKGEESHVARGPADVDLPVGQARALDAPGGDGRDDPENRLQEPASRSHALASARGSGPARFGHPRFVRTSNQLSPRIQPVKLAPGALLPEVHVVDEEGAELGPPTLSSQSSWFTLSKAIPVKLDSGMSRLIQVPVVMAGVVVVLKLTVASDAAPPALFTSFTPNWVAFGVQTSTWKWVKVVALKPAEVHAHEADAHVLLHRGTTDREVGHRIGDAPARRPGRHGLVGVGPAAGVERDHVSRRLGRRGRKGRRDRRSATAGDGDAPSGPSRRSSRAPR